MTMVSHAIVHLVSSPGRRFVRVAITLLLLAFLMSRHIAAVVGDRKCRPTSCAELQCYRPDLKTGGPYGVYPDSDREPLIVSCNADIDLGGWTVLQRRVDGRENFARGWDDYKFGFGRHGDLSELWLGNEHVHRMTDGRRQHLRIDATAFDGASVRIDVDDFRVDDEAGDYTLRYDSQSVSLTNVDTDDLLHSKDSMFSTRDHDNSDPLFCASTLYRNGGGWWFNSCFGMYLNGVYPVRADPGTNSYPRLLVMNSFHNATPLRFSEMKFRPVDYSNAYDSCVNPCRYGGSCGFSAREDAFRCTCTHNYTGATCETSVTETMPGDLHSLAILNKIPTNGTNTAYETFRRLPQYAFDASKKGRTIVQDGPPKQNAIAAIDHSEIPMREDAAVDPDVSIGLPTGATIPITDEHNITFDDYNSTGDDYNSTGDDTLNTSSSPVSRITTTTTIVTTTTTTTTKLTTALTTTRLTRTTTPTTTTSWPTVSFTPPTPLRVPPVLFTLFFILFMLWLLVGAAYVSLFVIINGRRAQYLDERYRRLAEDHDTLLSILASEEDSAELLVAERIVFPASTETSQLTTFSSWMSALPDVKESRSDTVRVKSTPLLRQLSKKSSNVSVTERKYKKK